MNLANCFTKKPTVLLSSSKSKNSVGLQDNSSHLSLPIDTYRFWFDALMYDDATVISSTLSRASAEDRYRLLNGIFDFMEDELDIKNAIGAYSFCKPLSVSVIYRSFNVLPILIEYGVELEASDISKNNILHLLVKRVLYQPQDEAVALNIYKLVDHAINKYKLYKQNNHIKANIINN